ncbi:hypothetical protein K493DRAFT_63300 [Basidiobolus meristosporus CBS 931.73]|uniref:Mediator of RNA polymerase II transcription subunit 12 n=1 Tax=Basidiobolus meristosporus CBS 931.73 TaxID=1314790 RepID=A0A1Y1XWX8_9FUNG|nr:hypothetical protein K493DRAFT_63300 [Basidiobolus meristosporus CBS 931.73]|eukprot:ORX89986.1 hypothetical protein K493DRAFT_63300 [Basidiobolus meristosporus CBS 931.73]
MAGKYPGHHNSRLYRPNNGNSGSSYSSLQNGTPGAPNLSSKQSQPPYGSVKSTSYHQHLGGHSSNYGTGGGYQSNASTNTAPSPNQSHPSSQKPNVTTLKKYTLLPPPKIATLHKTSDLGYPDFFPQRADQEEDQLTDANVRGGFQDRMAIQNESFSAHDMIFDRLQDSRVRDELSAFITDVLGRKQKERLITSPSIFRPPTRVSLNEQLKDQWIQDLVGGAVPLRKLLKSIPHGLKGDKLIETLVTNQTPLLRAGWVIKAIGLSELQFQRSKAPLTIQQYAVEWTNTFTQYMYRQLFELSTQNRATSSTSSINKPWLSEEARNRWTNKWLYSIKLAKWQYAEGILDQRHFLKWALDQFGNANFEQSAVLLPLITQLISEYERSRTLLRLLIDHLLGKIDQLRKHAITMKVWRHGYLAKELVRFIQALFLSSSDAFVHPVFWRQHRRTLRDVLVDDPLVAPIPGMRETNHFELEMTVRMKDLFEVIDRRNAVFTQAAETEKAVRSSTRTYAGGDLRFLSLFRVGLDSDFDALASKYFGPWENIQSTPNEFERKVFTLCNWVITNLRPGSHKIYIVLTLLFRMKEKYDQGVADEGQTSYSDLLQEVLLKFLDTYACTPANDGEEYDAIAWLYGEFAKADLFSYSRYLQRLISRGDLLVSKRAEEKTLRHLKYLQIFPLAHSSTALLNQRRIALYGVDGREEHETAHLELIKSKIRAKLPYISAACEDHLEDVDPKVLSSVQKLTSPIVDNYARDFHLQLPIDGGLVELLKSSTRFVQIYITQQWLLEMVRAYVVKDVEIGLDNWRVITSPGTSLLNPRQFSTIARIIGIVQDYYGIIELALWTLEHSMEDSVISVVIELIKQYQAYWISMGIRDQIINALLEKHNESKAKRSVNKALLVYLQALVHERTGFDPNTKKQLNQDLAEYNEATLAINSTYPATVFPPRVEELLSFANEVNPTTASTAAAVASTLWHKYHTTDGWLTKIFDSMVTLLTEAQSTSPDFLDFRRKLTRFSELLRELTPREASNPIIEWLRAPSHSNSNKKNLHMLESPSHEWFTLFLTILVTEGCVSISALVDEIGTNILEKVIQSLLKSKHKQLDSGITVLCKNILALLGLILGQPENNGQEMLLITIQEMNAIQSCLSREFQTTRSLKLLFHLVYQVCVLESGLPLNHDLSPALQSLRKELASVDWFRRICLADISEVYRLYMTRSDLSEKKFKRAEKQAVASKLLDTYLILFNEIPDRTSQSSLSTSALLAHCRDLFAKLNTHTMDRCRVELWLLLDKVMEENEAEFDTGRIPNENTRKEETLSQLAHLLFEEVPSYKDLDAAMMKHLFVGVRNDVAAELLKRAKKILVGREGKPFPENILMFHEMDISFAAKAKVVNGFNEILGVLLTSLTEDTADVKIDFLKALLDQVAKFLPYLKTFQVMESCNISFLEAENALHLNSNVLHAAISSVRSEENKEISTGRRVLIEDIRISLLIRLRLFTNVLPILWKNPAQCDVGQWITTLVQLLSNCVVHGNGTCPQTFEFVLDLVAVCIDEIPKEFKNSILQNLRAMWTELVLPSVFGSRLKRIFPFQIYNIYENQLKSNPTLKPWEFLEDSSGAETEGNLNDTPIPLTWFNAKRIRVAEPSHYPIVETTFWN